MRKNRVSKGKWILLLTAACSAFLASSEDAKAIGYSLPPISHANDKHELGQLVPGLAGDAEQYLQFMIGLPLGGSDHLVINGQDSLVTRSNNEFGQLPGRATLALTGEGRTIKLGTLGTYDYLLANYNGSNGVSKFWYVGDLTGTMIIPAISVEYGQPSWALFASGPQSVPDGGVSVVLLGAALGAFGLVRRYLLS